MFSTDSLTVRTSDGRRVVIIEGYTVTRKDGTVVEFPTGMTSDGASTPRALWLDLPPFGIYWMAAVSHDGMYRGVGTVNGQPVTKEFADDTFNEIMEFLGVPEIDRIRLYEGVHLFGGSSFEEDREAVATAPAVK